MIILDNFLPKEVFSKLQDYCNENEFQIVQAGEKQFSVLEVPENIYPFIQKEGYEIIFTFIRNAYQGFDDVERIHCDGIIMNKKTDAAAVLYINNTKGVTKNGTKFYSHQIHGPFLPKDATEEEFNRLITEDASDTSKWTETFCVKSKPNRMLSYKSNIFHGKWPAKIEKGIRKVLVVFYSKL
jgi:hypothetical protein